MSVYVIAEAGGTADGNRWDMHALIDIAARAGADAVKFQWTSDPDALAALRHVDDEALRDHYRRALGWPSTWLAEFRTHASDRGLDLICTVYLRQDIDTIALDVDAFKVAAFEASIPWFVASHCGRGKPVYVSVGMMDDAAARALACVHREVRVLHCVSSYPTPLDQLNLAVCGNDWCDGYSDHSSPDETAVGALAVAAGARVIEVHFRSSRTSRINPDYAHSRNPYELTHYIRKIREAERALGRMEKAVQPCETDMRVYRRTEA